jgi:hypothetical protein
MVIEGTKLWILVADLIDLGISRYTIEDALKRNRKGKITSWKHKESPNDKRVKLIDYDSLPQPTKDKLPKRADLWSLAQANNTEHTISKLKEICDTLNELHSRYCLVTDYHFFLSRICDKGKAEDLKQAAGWLRLLNKYKTKSETVSIGFEKKEDLRKAVVEQLMINFKQNKSHLYGFKVTNLAVLQRKELEWAKCFDAAFNHHLTHLPRLEAEQKANEAALGTLVHENFGNSNRRILGRLNADETKRILLPSGRIDFSEWNALTLVYLFMNPGKANKYDFENLYRRYEVECKKNDRKPEVEISAVKEFLTSDEVQLYTKREREGWAEFDKLMPHVYGKRPEYSLTKGGYDGFQIDFNSKIDGAQLMLTVVAVFDYMSEAITGFDINLVEDGLMVRNMYRNHLNMFGGRSYIEIESDRFSGNLAADTRKIFEQTCQYVTQPIPNDLEGKAPNPKARFVERLLQELNRLTQNVPGWKGTNITSIDKRRKPNPDYRSGNYVEGFAESVAQIIKLINIYNHDTYGRAKSRMQQCIDSIHPEAPTIPLENIALLLNQFTTTTIKQSLVSIEVNRKEYEYYFPDFDQHVHKMMKGYKVKVHFDESDMSTVYIFGQDDQFICTLERLSRAARDKYTLAKDETERSKLGKMTAQREKTLTRVTRKSLEVEAAQYGIDISNMTIEEAIELVKGVRITNGDYQPTTDEVFADALASPGAIASRNYYNDKLIRANGEAVPVSTEDQKGLDEKKRQLQREKYNRNNL